MPDGPVDPGSGGEGTGGSAGFGGTATAGYTPVNTNRERAPVNTDSFSQKIRLNVLTERIVAKVQALDVLTGTIFGITPALSGSNFPAVTLQHKVSTDGVVFTKLTGSTDVTAEGTFSVTVSGWPLYALEITVPAGSAAYAMVTLNAKANS